MTLSEFFVWLALLLLSFCSPVVFLSLWNTKIGETIQQKLKQIKEIEACIKEKEKQLSVLRESGKEEIQKIFPVGEEELIFSICVLPFDKVDKALLTAKETVGSFLRENPGSSVKGTFHRIDNEGNTVKTTLFDRINMLSTFVYVANSFNTSSKELTTNGKYYLTHPRVEIYGVYGPPKP